MIISDIQNGKNRLANLRWGSAFCKGSRSCTNHESALDVFNILTF